MANEEQLKILKQGVKVWNKWRKKHPDEWPDLKEVDLRKADLCGIDFWGVDLSGADLRGANLSEAYLVEAIFTEANLTEANLSWAALREISLYKATLIKASFCEADLRRADLSGAKLDGADLCKADLTGADFTEASLNEASLNGAYLRETILIGATIRRASFREADLSEAKLWKVDLSEADLDRADLSGSELDEAILHEANLHGADLSEANLWGTDLSEADLDGADLSGATLIEADFTNANITRVNLYGTSRDDWIIKDIKCEYVFWDREREKRIPENRNFNPGEFEELYKHLPTFEYYFEHGFTPIDAVVMSRVVQAINEQHPEFELKLTSFDSRGQPHAKFTVIHTDYVEDARRQIKDGYETRMRTLEGRVDQMERFFSAFIEQSKVQQDVFINQLAIAEKGGLTMGDTTNIGRDSITISDDAHVENFTTGASFQGDHAQQLLQSTTPQSSREDILRLLSFVQQELPKLSLPDDVKEEVAHEVKGAEIQAKKEEPDKKKIGEKLQSATETLEKVPKLTKAAITVGNLLGQAIVWCGMKWVEWKYGG